MTAYGHLYQRITRPTNVPWMDRKFLRMKIIVKAKARGYFGRHFGCQE
jgi:hypothetical protein